MHYFCKMPDTESTKRHIRPLNITFMSPHSHPLTYSLFEPVLAYNFLRTLSSPAMQELEGCFTDVSLSFQGLFKGHLKGLSNRG